MSTIKTVYAGLKLKNPIIVASSGLTDSAAKNKKLEEAGAAAVVLKSLFEEQILHEVKAMDHQQAGYYDGIDYLEQYVRNHHLGEYLQLIASTKEVCTIPVIASISCYQGEGWTEFAQEIEKAGADALEVNTMALQTETDYSYGSYEKRQVEIVDMLRQKVKLPIIVKLGENLTNPVALVQQLYAHGVSAVVLFNRLYQPDIDIEHVKQCAGGVFTTQAALTSTLRWLGISSARVPQISYAASGGVHQPEDVVKTILAGASAVEVCSALYEQGPDFIQRSTGFLVQWLEDKGIASVEQARGRLNQKNVRDTSTFERAQFMRYFSSREA